MGESNITTNIVTASSRRFIVIAPLLGNVEIDEIARRCRSLAAIKDFSALKDLSGRFHNDLAHYYEAVAARNFESPDLYFDLRVRDKYRPRVILTGGQSFLQKDGDLSIARRLIAESQRCAVHQNDWLTVYQAARQAAIIESIDGNHSGALAALRELFPLARWLLPRLPSLYYDYLNSVSVELLELGLLEPAQRLVSIAVASPYLQAYPEWLDTANEIQAALARPLSRSSVLISRPLPGNVVRLRPRNLFRDSSHPEEEPGGALLQFREPFFQMGKRIPTEEERVTNETRKTLRNKIVDALYERGEEIPEEMLEKLLKKIEDLPRKRETS